MTNNLELEKPLRQVANKLRNNMHAAAHHLTKIGYGW